MCFERIWKTFLGVENLNIEQIFQISGAASIFPCSVGIKNMAYFEWIGYELVTPGSLLSSFSDHLVFVGHWWFLIFFLVKIVLQAQANFKSTSELLDGLVSKGHLRNFEIQADEPPSFGGQDTAPNPVSRQPLKERISKRCPTLTH